MIAALRKEEWKEDVCNITKLVTLELSTGHGYQSLPVTTTYLSMVTTAFLPFMV